MHSTAASLRRNPRFGRWQIRGTHLPRELEPRSFEIISLAKIASDWKKPDGLFVIQPEEVDSFLLSLPVGRLPGVGRSRRKS